METLSYGQGSRPFAKKWTARILLSIATLVFALTIGLLAWGVWLAHRQMDHKLWLALDIDDVSTVRQLISSHPSQLTSRDSLGYTPLILACQRGDVDMVSYLVSIGAPVNPTDNGGTAPLLVATNLGSSDIVELLLK